MLENSNVPRKNSLHGNDTASVLLNLFTSVTERCHTTDTHFGNDTACTTDFDSRGLTRDSSVCLRKGVQ